MPIRIYKPGQGFWTRRMSMIAFSTVGLMGLVWLWNLLDGVTLFGIRQAVYVQAGASIIVGGALGWFIYYMIYVKPAVVDFMIATEGEMKKVNWSTRREIIGSTWVVIGLTLVIAILCFVFDRVFQYIFTVSDVLQT